MIIRIRTKDKLEELLRHGTSPAWVVSEWRVPRITNVEIYQFDGKRVLKATFEPSRSSRTQDNRLIVGFSDGKIEDCDYKWVGQNPIKYFNNNVEEAEEKVGKILEKITGGKEYSIKQTADEMVSWLENFDNAEIDEYQPDHLYKGIINNLWDLHHSKELHREWFDYFEEELNQKFWKNISEIEEDLNKWYNNLSAEKKEDLELEAELDDDEGISKTWDLFLFYGKMWEHCAPKHGDFIDKIDSSSAQRTVTKLMIEVLRNHLKN
jgi:hypothetical protein